MPAAHRYLVLRVVVADHPGALAAVTRQVADLGINIVSVEHHRYGRDLTLNRVEVVLCLETRGASDTQAVLETLQSAAFSAEFM